MAEMYFKKANETCDLGCYSERGILAYFMFVHLPNHIGEFLSKLEFSEGCENPFSDALKSSDTKVTIFSELDLGNEGFGKPDGAIYIAGSKPMMLFIEVKLNTTYSTSCKRKKNYNSTIRGQLELKWRLVESMKEPRHNSERYIYIRESQEMIGIYGEMDVLYSQRINSAPLALQSCRRLKEANGVGDFLKMLSNCEDRVWFCTSTTDTKNPFNNDELTALFPRCSNNDWDSVKHRFCWLPTTVFTEAGK